MSDLGTPDGREDTFGDDADLRPITMTEKDSVVELLRLVAAKFADCGNKACEFCRICRAACAAIPRVEAMERRLDGLDEACERFGLWHDKGGVSVRVLVRHLEGNWLVPLDIANKTNHELVDKAEAMERDIEILKAEKANALTQYEEVRRRWRESDERATAMERENATLKEDVASLGRQVLNATEEYRVLWTRKQAMKQVVAAAEAVRERAMEDGYWCDAINSGDDQDTVRLHVRFDTALHSLEEGSHE
jgi:hypothetical protein